MNWNGTDRDIAREESREAEEIQALTKAPPPSSLLSDIRDATVSLTELHVSGYDLVLRLIRR